MRPYRLTAMNPPLPRVERKEVIITEWEVPSYPVRLKEPLRQILIATRHIWDIPGARESVRENFRKVIDCRTAALGAEVYASDKEELLVPHTCKSRACSSCGHRAQHCGSATAGSICSTSRTPWSLSRCLTFCGQSFATIATFFATCRQSALK